MLSYDLQYVQSFCGKLTCIKLFYEFFFLQVEAEVSRLGQLKLSKLKELVMKKRLELEQICSQTHMVTEALSVMESSVEAMKSGKNFINIIYVQGYCK
jgi:hypothetical protein